MQVFLAKQPIPSCNKPQKKVNFVELKDNEAQKLATIQYNFFQDLNGMEQ